MYNLGDKSPYKLLTRQWSRQEISSLPISKDLLNILKTKDQLNELLNILNDISIKEADFDLIAKILE